MTVEKQTTFGWLVAATMFLGAAGASAFLGSFVLDILNKYEPIARVGAAVGTGLVLIDAVLLLSDLGTRANFYRLFSNPSSWMSRGACILTVFIVFSLGYSLSAFNLFAWLPWSNATAVGKAIGAIAAIFSVMVVVYTGFLLGVVKRVPLWNTPALPLLFFFSGLGTGIAILLLIAPFSRVILGPEIVAAFHALMIVEIVTIVMQLLMLGAYLEIAIRGGVSVAESVRLLKTPLFIVGVIIVGLMMPLALLSYGFAVSAVSILSIAAGTAGILLLIGGILLRYTIIRAAVYLPLYSV
ncbi:NrfD/PsrC family molybdoenzyme membrane anchor subunit [Thermodesulfobacteriota bacterium]